MPDTTSPPAVQLLAVDPDAGCSVCGSQRTAVLHPHHGRQCADHVTLPPGGFRRDLAEDMVDVGRADRAFAYLAAWLEHEAQVRFGAVAARLAVTA